jgi:hypothetical protein
MQGSQHYYCSLHWQRVSMQTRWAISIGSVAPFLLLMSTLTLQSGGEAKFNSVKLLCILVFGQNFYVEKLLVGLDKFVPTHLVKHKLNPFWPQYQAGFNIERLIWLQSSVHLLAPLCREIFRYREISLPSDLSKGLTALFIKNFFYLSRNRQPFLRTLLVVLFPGTSRFLYLLLGYFNDNAYVFGYSKQLGSQSNGNFSAHLQIKIQSLSEYSEHRKTGTSGFQMVINRTGFLSGFWMVGHLVFAASFLNVC